MTDEHYLTYDAAAAYLGLTKATLYRWVRQRRVPHHRVSGRTVRFRKADLDAWMDGRRRGGADAAQD